MFTSLINFLSLLPTIFIFVAACYYLSKISRIDSVLLFIGAGISLLLNIFYSFVMPYFMQRSESGMTSFSTYYEIASVISVLGNALFAVGFFILITNMINGKITVQNFFPPNTDN